MTRTRVSTLVALLLVGSGCDSTLSSSGVNPGGDSGPRPDSGPGVDSGMPVDLGSVDSGGFDSGGFDSGGFDSGAFDSGLGPVDMGSIDFGPIDPGDITPPEVSFVAPTASATLSGTTTLTATATDDVGVVNVAFRLDTATGTLLGNGTAAGSSYSISWNTAGASNGMHTLYAVARDAGGNLSEATVPVTINNMTSTTGSLTAVPTFEVLGLYLPRPSGLSATSLSVRYRQAGTTEWKNALDLWYDSRDTQFRGSILNLSAGSSYEVEVLNGASMVASGTFSTWSESFPVDEAHITTLTGMRTTTLNITESGTPTAYRLYTAAAGGAGFDMGFTPRSSPDNDHCIVIDASYIIIRGLTLRNCQANGIEIEPGSHDIVIEGNDFSNFGAGFPSGPPIEGDTATIHVGYNETAAIAATCYGESEANKVKRVIVQGNRIRNPRYGSNPWRDGHPYGTNGVGFFECGGNHVIRYNDVLGSHGHYLMDGIGGSDNFTRTGFPNNDSDIYGNWISHAYDDGIEAEGGNMQVRIWGNYITNTFIGIANGTVTRGPIYVVRNITSNHAGMWDPHVSNPASESERGLFFKLGSQDDEFVGGRAYYLHNTALQPDCPTGSGTCGIDSGMQNSAGTVHARNIFDANNIFTNFNSGRPAIGWQMDDDSGEFHNDLYIGNLDVTVQDGIEDYPTFAADVDEALELNMHTGGSDATRSYDPTRTPNEIGNFSLASSSPGYGDAMPLPNINDMYSSPDVGAHQSGTPNMVFGTAAWSGPRAW